jgi:NAD(P)-dependent dehydrogenase (short-subunit alcohol dehydrogenase family)
VTVNSVLPGPTDSEGVQTFLSGNLDGGAATLDDAKRNLIEQGRPTSLLGRLARPEEVANMIVYLSSEQASATTGAAVRVDGGVVRAVV